MPHIYLSPWEQYDDGIPEGEAWRPATGYGWIGGLLDLRTQTGRNICILEYPDQLPGPLPSGTVYLGDLWDVVLNQGLRRAAENVLNLPRDSTGGMTVGDIILQVFGQSRPTKDGRLVVTCGSATLRNQRVDDQ